MKRAVVLFMITGTVLMLSGCGFKEGAGATVTVVHDTPTPLPTPTPEPTPTPLPTPEPVVQEAPPTETTASGVVVTKTPGVYTASSDVNIRSDASTDSEVVGTVTAGSQLNATGVCDNNWIQIDQNGVSAYVSGDFVTLVSQGDAAAPVTDAATAG